MKLTAGGAPVQIRIEGETAVIDGRTIAFRAGRASGELTTLEIDGRILPVRAVRSGEGVLVWAAGRASQIQEAAGRAARGGEHAGDLVSPMPGRVLRILAAPGERIERGQPILVLEAMKMEHVMRAGRAGAVARIACAEGDQVEAGARLAEITEESESGERGTPGG